jgi:hypothetical protein
VLDVMEILTRGFGSDEVDDDNSENMIDTEKEIE